MGTFQVPRLTTGEYHMGIPQMGVLYLPQSHMVDFDVSSNNFDLILHGKNIHELWFGHRKKGGPVVCGSISQHLYPVVSQLHPTLVVYLIRPKLLRGSNIIKSEILPVYATFASYESFLSHGCIPSSIVILGFSTYVSIVNHQILDMIHPYVPLLTIHYFHIFQINHP